MLITISLMSDCIKLRPYSPVMTIAAVPLTLAAMEHAVAPVVIAVMDQPTVVMDVFQIAERQQNVENTLPRPIRLAR